MNENLIVTIAIGIVAALGTILTIYQSITGLREQLRLSIFTDYTKRFQEIQLYLPSDVGSEKFELNSLDPAEQEQFLRYMRAYFDLCSEEYFLYSKGKIDDEVWIEWKSGIQAAFQKPAFKIAWKRMDLQREDHAEFANFITGLYE